MSAGYGYDNQPFLGFTKIVFIAPVNYVIFTSVTLLLLGREEQFEQGWKAVTFSLQGRVAQLVRAQDS